jgi:hypothetical protein
MKTEGRGDLARSVGRDSNEVPRVDRVPTRMGRAPTRSERTDHQGRITGKEEVHERKHHEEAQTRNVRHEEMLGGRRRPHHLLFPDARSRSPR